MGLFGKKKNNEEKDHVQRREDDASVVKKSDVGNFSGFVLLSEPSWDKAQFLSDLKEEWGIDISADEKESEEKDVVYAEVDGFRVILGLLPGVIPNGEAERFAKANYMWRDAEEITASHQAHILVCVLGNDDAVFDKGRLYVKVVSAVLKQKTAISFYNEGAVYEPKMYRDCAEILRNHRLPILNWVWFGLYGDGTRAGVYTYGMRRFGKEEIEVYVPADKADLEDLRGFVLSIAAYVLDRDVTLNDGETIGFSAEQKLPITISPGIAVPGKTIKISLEN